MEAKVSEPIEVSFPEHISHTQRSMFWACPQKWYWAYCLKMRKHMDRGIDLRAGGAFAKGLEIARRTFYNEGQGQALAIEAGTDALLEEYGEDDYPDHKKNKSATLGALYAYFKKWPLGDDYLTPARFGAAGSGIEFKFSVPLPINHPTLNQPLLYDGRVDMFVIHKDIPGLWIEDDKTAGSLGAGWRRKWTMDAQPTSYIWAAQQHGYSVAGAIIRGISFLKGGYGVDEALVPRAKHQIDEWYVQLLRDAERMIATFEMAERSHRPDRAYDKDVCNAYSGCAFTDPCQASDPAPFLASMSLPRDLATPTGTLEDLVESF